MVIRQFTAHLDDLKEERNIAALLAYSNKIRTKTDRNLTNISILSRLIAKQSYLNNILVAECSAVKFFDEKSFLHGETH